MKKIDIGVVVTTLIIVTISCSLAFFAARVVGNPKDINLVAKNVAITFTDTSSISSNDTISPGWNNVKTFTITNNSKEDFTYNIVLKGLVNTFESINTLQYKITSDTGYNMDNYLSVIKTETSKDVVLAYDVVIPKGSKQTYQVEFKYISIEEDQSSDMGKKLGGTLAIEASTGTPEIYDKLLADNPTIKTRTDFSTTLTETNVNTLYKAKENNTDVYYFAGDARNNWVKFGEWQEDKNIILGYGDSDMISAKEYSSISECNSASSYNYNCKSVKIASKGDPMYWKIIRTNTDNSIRLLYAGTSPDTETGYIGTSLFNSENYGDPIILGYMYGTTGSLENNRTNENSSTMKLYLESWYSTNLLKESKYINQNTSFCNERTVSSTSNYNKYVIGNYYFTRISDRLWDGKTPSYNCENVKDNFSTNNSEAELTYPVGLMTADEVSFAGGVAYATADAPYIWYYNNSNNNSVTSALTWYTISPTNGAPVYGGNVAGVSGSFKPARLGNPDASTEYMAVRPVISLKGDLTYKSGDGSAEHPYEIEDFTSLKEKLLADNLTIKERTDFSTTFNETNTNTLYKSTEDNKEVYYFAGDVSNNWVKFGTWQEDKTVILGNFESTDGIDTSTAKEFSSISECNSYTFKNNKRDYTTANCRSVKIASKGDDMYWRIIRTNSDGSIRLLYSGTKPDTETAFIGTSNFNISDDIDPLYLGYMYGTSGSLENNRTNENSNSIKTYIDNWYETNLINYTKYLSTSAVYCNDRTVATMGDYTSYGVGKWIQFASFDRTYYAFAPTYNCTSKQDAFSVNNSEAKLTYPVALMTADEATFAGGLFIKTSSNIWYFINSKKEEIVKELYSWTLTPADAASSFTGNIMAFGTPNRIGYPDAISINHLAVRPVISIKGDMIYKSGDGSADNPYEIVTN